MHWPLQLEVLAIVDKLFVLNKLHYEGRDDVNTRHCPSDRDANWRASVLRETFPMQVKITLLRPNRPLVFHPAKLAPCGLWSNMSSRSNSTNREEKEAFEIQIYISLLSSY